MLTLFFYPWDRWADYKHIVVEAKNMVIPDRQMKPVQAQFLCGRFIAVEEPPFLGDYALMKSENLHSWGNAIMWAVGAVEHSGAVTIQSELENIFGKPVTELNPEPFTPVKKEYKHSTLW